MTGSGCCCRCLSGRGGVYVTGSLSLVGCMTVLLPSVYLLVQDRGWIYLREWLNSWLVRNHWDVEVTESVWRCLDWVDGQHMLLLAGLVSSASVHLLSSLLLILGTMLMRRNLLLPWIITDLLIISVMVLLFISWTFVSFFVDLLIAIVFPVIAGLLLGLWIILWRNTVHMYSIHFNPKMSRTVPKNTIVVKAGYTTVPADPRTHKLKQIT